MKSRNWNTAPLFALLCTLVFISSTAHGAPEALPDVPPAFFAGNDELRGYLTEAMENHPLLKAHFEDWRAALERIPQAGALEDPELTYTQFIVSDESYFMLAVEQKFPWFGTREVRKEKAAAEAEYWLAHLHEQRNAVIRDVKHAYFEYAFLMSELKLVSDQTGIMNESVEIARAQYKAGWSSEAEVLRMEQELARMTDMRRELEQMEPSSRATLNAALNRPQDGAITPPQAADFPPDPPLLNVVDQAIHDNNPSLRMYDHTIDADEKEVELARRMKYPDITVGVEFARDQNARPPRTDPYAPGRLMTYNDLAHKVRHAEPLDVDSALEVYDNFIYKETERGASDELKVSLGVNLPIWKKKIRAGIAEKEHTANATRWHKEDEQRMLTSEARETEFQWNDANRRIALYGDNLLQREEKILEGLRAEYASGNESASIPEMLESMKNIMEFHLESLRATKDKHLAAASLEYLIGAPW